MVELIKVADIVVLLKKRKFYKLRNQVLSDLEFILDVFFISISLMLIF